MKADKNTSSNHRTLKPWRRLKGSHKWLWSMLENHWNRCQNVSRSDWRLLVSVSKTGYSSSFTIEYRIRADVEKGEMVLEPWRKNDHDTLLYNTKQKTLKLQKSHWMAGTQETTQARAVGEWLLRDKSDTQTARLLDCVGVSVLKKGRRVYYWHTLWSPSADFQSIFPIIIYLSSNVGLTLGKMLLLFCLPVWARPLRVSSIYFPCFVTFICSKVLCFLLFVRFSVLNSILGCLCL